MYTPETFRTMIVIPVLQLAFDAKVDVCIINSKYAGQIIINNN